MTILDGWSANQKLWSIVVKSRLHQNPLPWRPGRGILVYSPGYISLTSNYNRNEPELGESPRQEGLKHTMTIDPDRLLDQILEVFVDYNTWLTFRQLASRLTGDESNEDQIAGVFIGIAEYSL